VLAITTIALTVFSLWVFATLVENTRNKHTEAMLNPPMCITDTGRDIPCPGSDQ